MNNFELIELSDNDDDLISINSRPSIDLINSSIEEDNNKLTYSLDRMDDTPNDVNNNNTNSDNSDNSENYDNNSDNDSNNSTSDYTHSNNTNSGNDSNNSDNNNYNKNDIILIQKENTNVDDTEVMHFINFCIDRNYFDNTFYDYGNAFSIIATKLPITFEQITTDGYNLEKGKFIDFFEEANYDGDIEYIYNQISKQNKNILSWDELLDFFLPFIKNITF